jgi:hypothetical protein
MELLVNMASLVSLSMEMTSAQSGSMGEKWLQLMVYQCQLTAHTVALVA